MAASKGLCLSWFIDPALPPALLIDSTRLQQILLNLLSNAIKVSQREAHTHIACNDNSHARQPWV